MYTVHIRRFFCHLNSHDFSCECTSFMVDEELESQVDYESIKDFEGDYDYDYDYAHVPNRSKLCCTTHLLSV